MRPWKEGQWIRFRTKEEAWKQFKKVWYWILIVAWLFIWCLFLKIN